MTKEQFVEKYKVAAIQGCGIHGISPLLGLAQSAVESRWGESDLAKLHNNLFGMKSTKSWEASGGKFVMMPTHEFTADVSKAAVPHVTRVEKGVTYYQYTIMAPFRTYDTPADCFANFGHFVTQPGYVKAGVLEAKSPEEQITCIAKAGYATAPDYAQKIIALMNELKPIVGELPNG